MTCPNLSSLLPEWVEVMPKAKLRWTALYHQDNLSREVSSCIAAEMMLWVWHNLALHQLYLMHKITTFTLHLKKVVISKSQSRICNEGQHLGESRILPLYILFGKLSQPIILYNNYMYCELCKVFLISLISSLYLFAIL